MVLVGSYQGLMGGLVASFHHRGDGTRAQGELFPPPEAFHLT